MDKKTLIVACRTLVDELKAAVKETGCPYPILWIESGLHLYTGSLHKRLQEELDRLDNVERVLLAFGYCGNALVGIKPPSFELIFPRVDDCITLLIGSQEERRLQSGNAGTYYLTRGWLVFENNIWQEYQQTAKRFGREKADRIFKVMLAHYKRLAVIDTGAYEVDDFLDRTRLIADTLGLEHKIIPGTLRYIKKLLTGPWDDEFVTIPPGETVALSHFHLDEADQPAAQLSYRTSHP